MSNEKEANYLHTSEGQDILASAIFRGIRTSLQKEYPTISFIKGTSTPVCTPKASTASVDKKDKKDKETNTKETTTVVNKKITNDKTTTASTKTAVKATETGTFSIQIMSSRDPIETSSEAFKKIGEKVIRQKVASTSDFKYRYLVGNFETKEEGAATLKKLQANGFKDAIIIQTE